MLERVVRAVYQNFDAIKQTTLLGLIIVFIYAHIGYAAFDKDYRVVGYDDTEKRDEGNGCNSLLECLVTHFDPGLRQDTGIAEYMSPLLIVGDGNTDYFHVGIRCAAIAVGDMTYQENGRLADSQTGRPTN